MTPYTYYLYHTPTKQHYYGVRTAEGCDPSELWVTYFSSSKLVKMLKEQYGSDSFKFQIRKVFGSATDAVEWETEFLSRIDAANRADWLNQSNGGGKFSTAGKPAWNRGIPHKKETRQKISQKRKPYVKEKHPMFGRKHTKESRQKISQHLPRRFGNHNHFYGKRHTDEVKQYISSKNKGVTSPRKGITLSAEQKQKQSLSMKNKPKLTCPFCCKIGSPSGMKRYHFENCKLNQTIT